MRGLELARDRRAKAVVELGGLVLRGQYALDSFDDLLATCEEVPETCEVCVQWRNCVETSSCSLSVQLPRSPMMALFGDSRSTCAGMTHGLMSMTGSSTVTS